MNATATKTTSQFFTAEDKARKAVIINLLAEGSTEAALMKELFSLNEKEAMTKEARNGEIANVKKSIVDLEIPFASVLACYSIETVFENAEVQEYAKEHFGKGRGPVSNKTARAPKTPKKTGEVLIFLEIPGAKIKGAKPTYTKGQDIPQFVSEGFKNLFLQHKDKFEAELSKYFTPAGKEHFAANADELAKFIKHVKEGKTTKQQKAEAEAKKAAKATAKA